MASIARVTPSEVYVLKANAERPGNDGVLYYVSRDNGSVGMLQGQGAYWGTLANGDMVFASPKSQSLGNAAVTVMHYGDVAFDRGAATISMPDTCQYVTDIVIGADSDVLSVTCYAGEDATHFLGDVYNAKVSDQSITLVERVTEPYQDGPARPFAGTTPTGIFTQE